MKVREYHRWIRAWTRHLGHDWVYRDSGLVSAPHLVCRSCLLHVLVGPYRISCTSDAGSWFLSHVLSDRAEHVHPWSPGNLRLAVTERMVGCDVGTVAMVMGA